MEQSIYYEIINDEFFIKFRKSRMEIDYRNADDLKLLLTKAIEELHYKKINIDCSNLIFFDSTVLGLLSHTTINKAQIVLHHLRNEIKDFLILSNLNRLFTLV